MYFEDFKKVIISLCTLRGWNMKAERPAEIWRQHRISQYSEESVNHGISRLKMEDYFDERVLLYHIKQHHSRSNSIRTEEMSSDQYEAQMLKDVGPNWKDMRKRCLDFIGDCMGNIGAKSDHFQYGGHLNPVEVDVRTFHRQMAKDFPGCGFEEV